MDHKYTSAHRSRPRKRKPTAFGWLKHIFVPMLVLIGTLFGIIVTLIGLLIPLVLHSSQEEKGDSAPKSQAVQQLESVLQQLTIRLATRESQTQRLQVELVTLRAELEQVKGHVLTKEAERQRATLHADLLDTKVQQLTTQLLEKESQLLRARAEAVAQHARVQKAKPQIQEKDTAVQLLQGLAIDKPGRPDGSLKPTFAITPNDSTVSHWSPVLTPLMKKSLDAMNWPLLLKEQEFKKEREELITLLSKLSGGCSTPEEVAETHNGLKKAIDLLVQKCRAIDDGQRHLHSFRARAFLTKLVTEVAMVCQ